MAAFRIIRLAQVLKTGLHKKLGWTYPSNTSFVVSVQVVLMTALTDIEPLAKRIRVETSARASSTPSLKVSFLSLQRKENEIIDPEKRQNNTETSMDARQKNGADGLRGVKTKGYHQRIGPRQRQKFRNTLEQWLVKPSKNPNTPEVCQSQEDIEMGDERGFNTTTSQSIDHQNVEKCTISDSDEETQPRTPQGMEEDTPMPSASKEKEDMDACPANSEGSVKHNTKITDFFSGTSTPGFPQRKKEERIPGGQDSDEESSTVGKPGVKWLGTPIYELKRMPECGGPLPPLKDVPGQHTVMIRV